MSIINRKHFACYYIFMICTLEDLRDAINEYGFLPFFRSVIPGLSLEEMVDRSIWFPPDGMGVWDWKTDAIEMTGGTYGKFFCRAPGFVSAEMMAPLLAYRRDGYDFEGFSNDGHAKRNEIRVYSILEETGSETSTFLKAKSNMSESSFNEAITGLQMKGFVVISGFDYRLTKDGRKYGWGISRYAIPEAVFGEELERKIDEYTPEDALSLMKNHLRKHFPGADERSIDLFLTVRK